jgi:hypothetical protein
MSINIVLSNGQDGYSAIREYIIQHWDTNGYATCVVRLATSCDGRKYLEDNEIVSPYFSKDGNVLVEFLYDWWEGEPYIKILGIKNIHEIELTPTDDVVEVVRCRDCKHHPDNGGECDRSITHTGRDYVCEVNTYRYIGIDYCSYGERREE